VQISLVLFDEIEKASDALWNLLLGILDKATLTLGDNRKVSFEKAIVFLTSNIGSKEMESLINPTMGFAGSESVLSGSKLGNIGIVAARKKFTPEFINRLDKIITFQPLGESELRAILELELGVLQRRIIDVSNSPCMLCFTDSLKDYLLKEGFDRKSGARHIKRTIDKTLVYAISNLMATKQIRGGDAIKVDYDGTKVSFHRDDVPILSARYAAASGMN
jgi:ATP-dependent Clp protease ATP-binding subunit ClpA